MSAAAPVVSIIVPHFQTPDLARLCLRSIRRHTRTVPHEVIVIDNGSRDGASLEYLRQVEWIRLIERTENIGWREAAHKEAVDLGIAASSAPYVLAFHTDTVPIREDWLDWHVAQIEADPRIAAVGTYKLELKSPLGMLWARLQRTLPHRRGAAEEIGDHRPYIRSHCALYRRDVLLQLGLKYDGPDGNTAGRGIHYGLERHGFIAKQLNVVEALRRIVHLNHGTMIVRPELGARRRSIRAGLRRIERFLATPAIRAVFDDASLDRGLPGELLRAA